MTSPALLPADLRIDGDGRRERAGTHDVMAAILSALGHGSPVAGIELPRARRCVLVVIDGMGWHQVGQRLAHARAFVRSAWESARPIPTCAPATTAAAITTLTTGAWPGETNMLGYEVVDPTAGPFSLITFRARGTQRVLPVEGWNPQPSAFATAAELGVRSIGVVPPKFAGSGLTLQALGGLELRYARSLDERVHLAALACREAALTYLYVEHLDHVGHHAGWDSPDWLAQLDEIDRALATLAARLPAETLLVVTSDHGMINPDSHAIYDLADSPLARDDVMLGGEPRALHVHVRGGDSEEIAERWRIELGEHADIVRACDLAPYVGPIARADLIGDFWVWSRERASVVDSRVHTASARAMKGIHGSLTPEEIEVPLLVELS
ncbi:alkaline phosphatase family protein [Nanchangia anserum]|uniref:Alkaline phosphatase family protein n=1 Tax=Nanchangia anserum TaxID=2692125 RepID=A0A8I0GC47_9ACTO|nr:alkaline phosphatase family protein [Nanchangia anserum]MBD3688833.1 alkaline phosphatase family protein [Nanchangia anserum]QOX81107.1 alkaline phosphatase family protein [Nanchangia anserum]